MSASSTASCLQGGSPSRGSSASSSLLTTLRRRASCGRGQPQHRQGLKSSGTSRQSTLRCPMGDVPHGAKPKGKAAGWARARQERSSRGDGSLPSQWKAAAAPRWVEVWGGALESPKSLGRGRSSQQQRQGGGLLLALTQQQEQLQQLRAMQRRFGGAPVSPLRPKPVRAAGQNLGPSGSQRPKPGGTPGCTGLAGSRHAQLPGWHLGGGAAQQAKSRVSRCSSEGAWRGYRAKGGAAAAASDAGSTEAISRDSASYHPRLELHPTPTGQAVSEFTRSGQSSLSSDPAAASAGECTSPSSTESDAAPMRRCTARPCLPAWPAGANDAGGCSDEDQGSHKAKSSHLSHLLAIGHPGGQLSKAGGCPSECSTPEAAAAVAPGASAPDSALRPHAALPGLQLVEGNSGAEDGAASSPSSLGSSSSGTGLLKVSAGAALASCLARQRSKLPPQGECDWMQSTCGKHGEGVGDVSGPGVHMGPAGPWGARSFFRRFAQCSGVEP